MKKTFLIFSLLSFAMLWTHARNPKMNWDGIAYTALTIHSNEMDVRGMHQTTYEMLRKYVPDSQYRTLTQPGLRAAWSSNAERFVELLPVYKVKYLYILVLRTLWKLGIEPFQAMTMISLLSSVALCLLIFFWVVGVWGHWTSGIVAFLICYMAGVYDVSNYWTPDAIAALTVCSSGYLLINKRSASWGIIFSILSVWLRPDSVFILVFISLYVALASPPDSRAFGPRVLLGLLATLGISIVMLQSISGYTGPFHHLSITRFVEGQASSVVRLTFTDYIGFARMNLGLGLRESNPLYVFLLVAVVAFFIPSNRTARVVLCRHLMPLSILAILVKLIAFPILETRFFVSIYCLTGVAVTEILWEAISHSTSKGDPLKV